MNKDKLPTEKFIEIYGGHTDYQYRNNLAEQTLEYLKRINQNCYINVTSEAIITTKVILRSIPKNKKYPKFDIDSDGCVLMIWYNSNNIVCLGCCVDSDGYMHWCLNPGENSSHLNFSVLPLDESIINNIPDN